MANGDNGQQAAVQLPPGYQDAAPVGVSLPPGYSDAKPANAKPTGPTIGPRSTAVVPAIPTAMGTIPAPVVQAGWDAAQKLEDWANMTQEGVQQHPVQAEVGQIAARLKQYLVGGQGGGQDLKTGFLTNPVMGAVTGLPEDESLNAARGVYQGAKNLAERFIGAPAAAKEAVQATEAGRAISQTMAPETANAALSSTRGAATTGGAATTSITNRDVIQHASDMGIKLTPAQALQTSAAKSEQTLGEEALLTGSKIKEAAAAEKAKLADQVSAFQDKLDPQKVGMSAESAGEHLQNSADIARSVLKDNVNQAYADVKAQQADLAGDVRPGLQQMIHDESFMRQPSAAVERPVFLTSGAKSAINDIQGMLEDPAMQGIHSSQSLRNLRTTLLEKGNDYGANALSDSGQRIYKLAAGKVDDAIMDAAKGTPFEQTFRDAGQQNAKLQSLYNQKGSPLYRILNTDDPAAVTNGILNRSSVQEIETLKGEKFDLGPLARQAVEDIKDGGFKVTTGGLGGYPDTFLRSLLGPEATKELYMKADVARRLAENYNPSGSGKVVLGASQVFHPVAAVGAQAARLRSMPQDALNFLPKIEGPTSPITGGPIASPQELFTQPGSNVTATPQSFQPASRVATAPEPRQHLPGVSPEADAAAKAYANEIALKRVNDALKKPGLAAPEKARLERLRGYYAEEQ